MPDGKRGQRLHAGSELRWLLLCDHAGRRLPAEHADLGLARADLDRHIAVDFGAYAVARRLAAILRAPLIAQMWSRLLIDANRGQEDPTLIPEVSDGTTVPGNLGLTVTERRRRWEHYHQPYHHAIATHLRDTLAQGIRPFLVAIHSFTPTLAGQRRPWEIGVLWKDDPTLAQALIVALRATGAIVGDNQPYDGHVAMGHTLAFHAEARQLPHTLIELRQDLVATRAQAVGWARRLAAVLCQPAVQAAVRQGLREATAAGFSAAGTGDGSRVVPAGSGLGAGSAAGLRPVPG